MLSIIKNLQKELTIFLVTIAFCALIVITSISLHDSSLNNKNQALTQLKSATSRYYTSIDRKELLEQFEKKYLKLKDQGIVGAENRLHWVDVLENISTNRKIPYMKYNIDKQIKLTSKKLSAAYPGIDVFQSTMTLKMQLLHEGDLFSILNSLEAKTNGLFDVQSCSISKNKTASDSIIESKSNHNFSSICRLNWYTVTKKTVVLPKRRRS